MFKSKLNGIEESTFLFFFRKAIPDSIILFCSLKFRLPFCDWKRWRKLRYVEKHSSSGERSNKRRKKKLRRLIKSTRDEIVSNCIPSLIFTFSSIHPTILKSLIESKISNLKLQSYFNLKLRSLQ